MLQAFVQKTFLKPFTPITKKKKKKKVFTNNNKHVNNLSLKVLLNDRKSTSGHFSCWGLELSRGQAKNS